MTVPDVTKLRSPDSAPKNGSQILAWGTQNDNEEPRWMIVQWVPMYPRGEPSWIWSAPGYCCSSVIIIGWLPLPWNDYVGNANMGLLIKSYHPSELPDHMKKALASACMDEGE